MALAIVLIACAAVDANVRRLPDWLTLPLVAGGLLYGASSGVDAAIWHLLGAIAGFLSLYFASRLYLRLRQQHGLGLGDAKLIAAAGAWLGPLYLAPVVFLGAILALAFVLILRVAGREVSWTMTLPFGPFLGAGFFICWCVKLIGWPPVL